MTLKKGVQLLITIMMGCCVGVQFMPVAVAFVQTSVAMLMASIQN